MRSTSLHIVGLVVAIVVVLGLPADAGAQGAYGGAGLGWTDINLGFLGKADATGTHKLFLGYELPRIVGFEAAWVNLGSHEDTWVRDAPGTLDTGGWTAAVTGRAETSKVFAMYGKLGCFFWNTRFHARPWWGDPTVPETSNGRELFWGAGMRFNAGRIAFLGEYERYITGELGDHKVFSFAVRYTF